MKTLFISIIIAGLIAVNFTIFRSGTVFKSFATTIFQGISSLLAVNVIGLFTGVSIALNWYTLGFVSFFGIPASISLLLLNTIFR